MNADLLSSVWQFFCQRGGELQRYCGALSDGFRQCCNHRGSAGCSFGRFSGIEKISRQRTFVAHYLYLDESPPVLAGLLIYLLFARTGPLGFLDILFTPPVMVVAQVLLATPIITALSSAAIAAKEKLSMDTARTLGASERQAAWMVIKEARTGILAGIMTGFGRAFGEVGAVMLVGGNVRYQTRVLTTSIVLETRQGNYEFAIALGLILLLLSFVVSSVLLKIDDSKLS